MKMAMTWDSHSLSLATRMAGMAFLAPKSDQFRNQWLQAFPRFPISPHRTPHRTPARFEYDDRTRKVKASQKVLNAMRKVEAARGHIIARSGNPSDLIWELIIICPD